MRKFNVPFGQQMKFNLSWVPVASPGLTVSIFLNFLISDLAICCLFWRWRYIFWTSSGRFVTLMIKFLMSSNPFFSLPQSEIAWRVVLIKVNARSKTCGGIVVAVSWIAVQSLPEMVSLTGKQVDVSLKMTRNVLSREGALISLC